MSVRTRFAPSPTGLLHLGNVRVAVFNWLFARHHGGAFVLRLEDTDVERNQPGSEEALMEDLRWLGLAWDEGPDVGGRFAPYRQSQRSAVYEAALHRLLADGFAFRCFCGEGEGDAWDRGPDPCRELRQSEAAHRALSGEPHVLRYAAPTEGEVTVEDAVRGAVTVAADEIDDFVLRRTDGRVTYNFGVVVDDLAMKITHVIRGAGHLSNTPRQALLFDALGGPRPVFAHLPTVLDPEGGKLSKRAGATSVASYREAGYLPAALVNYLSLLGWSDAEGEEILTPEELVERVSLERVGASDTAYDPDKLHWVAEQHMARLSLEDMIQGVRPYVDQARSGLDDAQLLSAVEALRTRLGAFGEIDQYLPLMRPDAQAAAKGREALAERPEAVQVLAAVAAELEALEDWEPGALGAAVRAGGKAVGARGPALFHPVRLALTGEEHGPDLARIMHVLGRDEVMTRIRRAEGPTRFDHDGGQT